MKPFLILTARALPFTIRIRSERLSHGSHPPKMVHAQMIYLHISNPSPEVVGFFS